MRQIIAGNWKMNPVGLEAGRRLAEAVAAGAVATGAGGAGATLILCPPFPMLAAVEAALSGSTVALGAQDCAANPPGAHTGEVAAEMLADLGARYVLVGHSERRAMQGESDATIAAKIRRARAAGLTPILCVGETLAEREAGHAEAVVRRQLAAGLPDGFGGIIAYEPVWAIGTGLSAGPGEISAMHGAIGEALAGRFGRAGEAMPVLYGGSVKPDNAAELLALPRVGGALVGGASLDADAFLAIAEAGREV